MASILPFFIAIPLGCAFIIPLLRGRYSRYGAWVSLAGLAVLTFMAVLLIGGGPFLYSVGGPWDTDIPIRINLICDSLTVLLLVMVSVISLVVCVYAFSYMKQYTGLEKFYALFMLMIAGMNGVVLTGDIFNMFVFLEVAAIASYALVAFGTEHEELEASFKYLVLGSIASAFILFGIAILYSLTGTLNLADLNRVIGEKSAQSARVLLFVAGLFIMGFGLKAALVPFHAWLPDAHPSAPAPISAMLSGLLIKTLGIYALIRIFYHVFGIQDIFRVSFLVLGAVSMLVGVLLAMGQSDFKRLLAYCSISQVGYVMLAVGVGTPLALVGGLFHLLNHAVFKSLLFLCSGAIEKATGTRQIKELGGLWKRMPFTSVTCSMASLSISGVPPFNGFWSKLIIVLATVRAAQEPWLRGWAYFFAAIAVVESVLTLILFVKVQKYIIFGPASERVLSSREVSMPMITSLVVLAALCLGLGLFAPAIIGGLIEPAQRVLTESGSYVQYVLGK